MFIYYYYCICLNFNILNSLSQEMALGNANKKAFILQIKLSLQNLQIGFYIRYLV